MFCARLVAATARAALPPAGAAAPEPQRLLARLLAERLPGSPVVARLAGRCAETAVGGHPAASRYERHREEILAAYREGEGNLSTMEKLLRDGVLRVHRRWLADFLDKWGVRKRRARTPSD